MRYSLDTLLKYDKFYILYSFIVYFSLTWLSLRNDNAQKTVKASLIQDLSNINVLKSVLQFSNKIYN